GGSILGDKTRMEELARDPNAFIRPTPSKGTLGGTARYTREAMMVLEAAGYDVIIVETVGVGQSEVAVANMVDMFLLLLSPTAGDELQGIKRGIMELADLIIVNKADGDFINAARLAKADVSNAVHLMRPKSENWIVDVLECSALERKGLEDIWQKIIDFQNIMEKTGELASKRLVQGSSSIWSELNEQILDDIKVNNQNLIHELEELVKKKNITARQAANKLHSLVYKPKN
ncbi:MAG: methylmalonyl Co-A mutase-associated GTPase MeaB, partial [Emcibacteraceae bacterium]|nr:methylmalonyl Co-A mutase-associated GTPase MeaB [Emcibacteraceae bacterium]